MNNNILRDLRLMMVRIQLFGLMNREMINKSIEKDIRKHIAAYKSGKDISNSFSKLQEKFYNHISKNTDEFNQEEEVDLTNFSFSKDAGANADVNINDDNHSSMKENGEKNDK